MTLPPITRFFDDYRWLSNFWPARVRGVGGLWYPTVEHGYVAAKSKDPEVWKAIQQVEKPGQVKRIGRTIELRPEWESYNGAFKIAAMSDLLEQKFADPILRAKLNETKGRELIEGNTWGDTFWGQCPVGNGHNHLGKLIMSIRDDVSQYF